MLNIKDVVAAAVLQKLLFYCYSRVYLKWFMLIVYFSLLLHFTKLLLFLILLHGVIIMSVSVTCIHIDWKTMFRLFFYLKFCLVSIVFMLLAFLCNVDLPLAGSLNGVLVPLYSSCVCATGKELLLNFLIITPCTKLLRKWWNGIELWVSKMAYYGDEYFFMKNLRAFISFFLKSYYFVCKMHGRRNLKISTFHRAGLLIPKT